MNDNNSLRTSFEKQQFVIVVEQNGVNKYVAKHYGRKTEFQFTVLLNKAHKFDTSELAEKFADERNIKNVINIAKVIFRLSLVTQMPS